MAESPRSPNGIEPVEVGEDASVRVREEWPGRSSVTRIGECPHLALEAQRAVGTIGGVEPLVRSTERSAPRRRRVEGTIKRRAGVMLG
jgi:hypothetical protein